VELSPPSDAGLMKFEDDYTNYWGLRALPFDNVPDPRFYVPCLQHDAAHRWLNYGIQTRKGILLLTGDIGCGKTLLSRRLIVGLSPARYDVALVANPALSPSEMLDEVLSQFGLGPVRSKAARLQMLNERLQLNEQRGISSVLVVDEAQAIESVNGFEELRLLTNFQLNDRFLLTVVLIGQPELRCRVEDIPQLSQRIAVRAHLGPFTAEETTAYIGARMGAVTDRTEVFTKEAMAFIYEQSRGIGRVINALCDQCLFAGAIEQVAQIDGRLVQLVGQVKNTPIRPVESIEQGAESIELNQNSRINDELLDAYRQAVARLKPLEEELLAERNRAMHSALRVVQLEGELGRITELKTTLAGEQERVARLNKELAGARSATARVEELESLGAQAIARVNALEQMFAAEQQPNKEISLSLPETERASQRVQMFESLLQMERALKTFWRDSYLKLNEPSD